MTPIKRWLRARSLCCLIIIACVCSISSGQGAPQEQAKKKPLTNDDIIAMVARDHFGENVIINAIQTSKTQFNVDDLDALRKLKAAGVSEKIIEAMQNCVKLQQAQQGVSPGTTQPPPANQPTPDLGQYYAMQQPNISYVEDGKKRYLQPNPVGLSEAKGLALVEGVERQADSVEYQALEKSVQVIEIGQAVGSQATTMAGINANLTIGDALGRYNTFKALLPSTEKKNYLILASHRRSPTTLQTKSPQLHVLYGDILGVSPDDFEPVLVKFVTTKDNYRVAGVLRLVHKKSVMALKPKLTCSFLEQRIPIKVKQLGRGDVEVEPENQLEVGEYALVLRPHWKSKEVSDKDLKEVQVAQALMNAMWDFSISATNQNKPRSLADPSTQKEAQASENPSTVVGRAEARSEQYKANDPSAAQDLPVYGKIEDIKGFRRIYVYAENAQSRERILKALKKAPEYEIVSDAQEAQIILEFKELSHHESMDKNGREVRIKSQLSAIYMREGKRVIAWSDTSDYAEASQVIGFRTQYSEVKLADRFIKAIKKGTNP